MTSGLSPSSPSLAVAIALLLQAAAIRPALAEGTGPLAAARAAKERVDYEVALVEVDRVLEAGDLSLADMRAALRLRGEFLAVLGRSAEAEETFAELLAADPDARLDPGLAPRVLAAFRAAAARPHAPVTVSCAVSRAGRLSVRLDPGSSARARLVRVERALAGSARGARDDMTPPAELVLPLVAVSIACFAVDERGNALAAGPGWERPLAWSPPPRAAPRHDPVAVSSLAVEPRPSRPLWRNPWLWASAAAAAGAAGATFGWLARQDQRRLDQLIDQSESHQFGEAQELLARGRSRTGWARGLAVGAGALAAAAVTFALWPSPPVRRAGRRSFSPSLALGPAPEIVLRAEF